MGIGTGDLEVRLVAAQFVYLAITQESVDNVYVFESEGDAEAFADAYDCEARDEPTVIVSEMPIFAHRSEATRELIATAAPESE
ncbi:MAG: hypothetical protein ACYCZN_01720 [Candidatus Dormibacteria bacterium]